MNINFNYTNILDSKIIEYIDKIRETHKILHEEKDDEAKFLGWLEQPLRYDKEELEKIKKYANVVKENSKYLLVIGIGGSYLGARAVIESLTSSFYNIRKNNGVITLYVGNNLSANYINDVINLIKDEDFSINVISKSGTTTEPAISFRIFKKLLIEKYGIEESKKRIYVTTDSNKGALHDIAKEEGYVTFNIPSNIGGRYSVLTAVGLFPIAVSNINIDKLLNGALKAYNKYNNDNLLTNDCYKYAVIRNILYKEGKNIEILSTYEPNLQYITEWWKQLFGESEGKDGKGVFPASCLFTTDLHSLGQYIQEGRRNLFETVINVKEVESNIFIEEEKDDLDNLNYLKNKSLNYINHKAMDGVINAHIMDDVPNIIINIDSINEETIGELLYFFMLSCAVSGLLLGVNPFDQPGVEKYKTNMFKLLNKPGYTNND